MLRINRGYILAGPESLLIHFFDLMNLCVCATFCRTKEIEQSDDEQSDEDYEKAPKSSGCKTPKVALKESESRY